MNALQGELVNPLRTLPEFASTVAPIGTPRGSISAAKVPCRRTPSGKERLQGLPAHPRMAISPALTARPSQGGSTRIADVFSPGLSPFVSKLFRSSFMFRGDALVGFSYGLARFQLFPHDLHHQLQIAAGHLREILFGQLLHPFELRAGEIFIALQMRGELG